MMCKPSYAIPTKGCKYIIKGKHYPVQWDGEVIFEITTDEEGEIIFCQWKDDGHINGDWVRKYEDETLSVDMFV